MVCSVCFGYIKDDKSVKLFNAEVCPLCMDSISQTKVDHVCYDYYKDRIKAIESKIFKKQTDK